MNSIPKNKGDCPASYPLPSTCVAPKVFNAKQCECECRDGKIYIFEVSTE